MPPTPGVSNAGTEQAREALHVRGQGGTGGVFSATSRTDGLIGKAIASGHQEKVYGDPASKNRIVGHGGYAPKHQMKPSGFGTVLLVLLFLAALLYYLTVAPI